MLIKAVFKKNKKKQDFQDKRLDSYLENCSFFSNSLYFA